MDVRTGRRNHERYELACQLRENGLSWKDLAAHLGVSVSRARQMVDAQIHHRARLARLAAMPPKWHEGAPSGLWAYDYESRAECMVLASDDLVIAGPASVWEPTSLLDWRSHLHGRDDHTYCSPRRMHIDDLNEIRAWLGVPPFEMPMKKPPSKKRIMASIRLLEKAGYSVTAPDT